jgi:hypothetical protein
VSRIGLGRHGGLRDDSGDPLDGLVNLFDIGIVLAVAFLVAGLTLTVDERSGRVEREPAERERQARTLPSPSDAAPATGRGSAVGTVYRLSDGRLVYVEGEDER